MRATPRVGVVADDITGAGDIGVLFALHGLAVRIFSAGAALQVDTLARRLGARRADVAILDTDSRFDPPAVARDKVMRASRVLVHWGATVFHKKTCSVFRGNVGAEMDAMLDEIGEPFSVVVAAFPRNGRSTRDGVHRVHGRPLAESEFAHDPVHPRRESNLVIELAGQTARRVAPVPLAAVRGGQLEDYLVRSRAAGVQYALCDCETQDDLRAIASASAGARVLCGSSAIGEELPRFWEPPAPFDPFADVVLRPSSAVLVVAGSVMPQTRTQVAVLEGAGAAVFTIATSDILTDSQGAAWQAATRAAAALAGGRHVVLRAQSSPDEVTAERALGARRGLDPISTSRLVSECLAIAADLALSASAADRLIALGGDTSAAVCARLGIDETIVLDEIEAGIPALLAPGTPARLLVLKSGSFGTADFLLRAIARLRALSR